MVDLLSALYAGGYAAVRGTRAQQLHILIYHRVLAQADLLRPAEPTAAEFDWQMGLLRRYFNPLGLAEALERLEQGKLPPRSACVTFDDGYINNLTVALPVLQRYGVPATVFVASDFLRSGVMWNDVIVESFRQSQGRRIDLRAHGLGQYAPKDAAALRRDAHGVVRNIKYAVPEARDALVADVLSQTGAQPPRLMMNEAELRALHAAGVEIGAHTCSHPILTKLSESQARAEIAGSKAVLEGVLAAPVRFFAYPNGRADEDYAPEHAAMVREAGFEAAVTTNVGTAVAKTDRYNLPRFTPWDRTPGRFLARLALTSRRVEL